MTPRELADEAREALRREPPRTPDEVFQRLIDAGIIALDANGKVKVLFGMNSSVAAQNVAPGFIAEKKRKKVRKPKRT